MAKTAVYPGSFDPVTNGHIDVIQRAAKVFDHLTVAVLINDNKKSLFTLEERIDILKNSITGIDNISFDSFSGLLTDYCKEKNLSAIVRGLRAVSDFEFEMQMAQMNRQLYDGVETVFLTTSENFSYLSSSIVKEVAKFNGNIDAFVPDYAIMKIKEKMSRGE